MAAPVPRKRLAPPVYTTAWTWPIVGAFAVIYLVWGSTYLANLWAIGSIPPFLMAGLRFCGAGILLYGWTVWRGMPLPPAREWGNAALMGVLFLSLGTGGVVWAEQYIDSGLTALVVSAEPLIVILLLWMIDGKRPAWLSWLGVAVGIVGTILLVGQPVFTASREAMWGLAAIFIALTAWGIGSIYVSRVQLPASRLQATAMQMLAGGLALVLLGTLTGEWSDFSLSSITVRSWLSWLYLLFFGSILAFSCFNYLLTRVSPARVATSTYVHPVVALLLGTLLNAETITSQSILAGGLLLLGVFFIHRE